MKRVTMLIALVLCVSLSFGQNVSKLYNLAGTSGVPDTITNAATTYLTVKGLKGGNYVTFQLDVLKVSGTVAGNASLEGSADSDTNPAYWTHIPNTDSLTLTDGTSVKLWTVRNDYPHYRIKIVSTGTQRSIPRGFYYLFKY